MNLANQRRVQPVDISRQPDIVNHYEKRENTAPFLNIPVEKGASYARYH